MSINNKIRRFLRALRFWKWTAKDFRKAGVDTRYASEIVKPDSPGTPERPANKDQLKARYLLSDAFLAVSQERLLECEKKLEDAAHALSVIECLTYEKPFLFADEICKIHEIAQEAWRKQNE